MSKLKELLPKKQNKGDKNKQENSQQFRNRVDVLGWTHFRRKDTEYKCIDHIGVPVVATERMEATDYSMMNGCNTDEPLYQLTIQNGESDWRYHNTCLSDAYGIRISTCIKLEAIPDGIGKFPEYKLEKVYDDRLKTEQISKFEYAVIEFGCYPQDRAENSYQLEQLYQMNALQPTGKSYIGYMGKDYKLVRNPEFVFEGERYVRVLVKNLRHNNAYEFKNGRELLDDGSPCWAKVQPIRWVIRNWDELPKNINPLGSGTAEVIDLSCESSILGNIPYGLDGKNKYDNLWQNSLLRAILNGYDLQEQLEKGNGDPSRKNDINYNFKGQGFIDEAFFDYNALTKQYTQQKEEGGKIMKTRLSQLNPDKTPEESRRLMTDTEIIKSWIDAGESVLLRGPSGIGKTERIKTLYPDLIYIKLTNNMFPEKVVGSLNLQTGQSIPPDFAKEAILACANEEERQAIKENIQNIFELADIIYERSKNADKKTVILLDELLNVKPAVQSLVYSLVLNKMVEMGHGLKLPNTRVLLRTWSSHWRSVLTTYTIWSLKCKSG